MDYVLIDKSPTRFEDVGRMGLGLFSFEDKAAVSDLTCRFYSDAQLNSMDGWFQAARIIAILANIFIGLGMISLVCLSCIVVRKTTLTAISALLLIGGLLEGFTLILFASDATCRGRDCEFFFGAGLAILCTTVTLFNAMMTYNIPEAEDDDDYQPREWNQKGGEEVNKELQPSTSSSKDDGADEESSSDWTVLPESPHILTKKLPDGRRHIIKTIVNQDGSRTVEEQSIVG